MSWHYQIRKREDKGLVWYDIVEVYADPIGWSRDSQAPTVEMPKELIRTIEMMLGDAKKYPVLEGAE